MMLSCVARRPFPLTSALFKNPLAAALVHRISGLVVEYIVAIDVTRVRFSADAQVKLARLVREVTEPTGGQSL